MLNMHNKAVQERLCTEPKNSPNEALQFAVAFKEGVKRPISYGSQNWDSEFKTKDEQFLVCTITSGKICFRCGALICKAKHTSQCRAAKKKCGKRRIFGRFTRCCGKLRSRKRASAQNMSNQNAARRINYIEECHSSNCSDDETTGNIVWQLEILAKHHL